MAQHFGERLQQVRQAKGFTVYEAAKRAGIPNQVLYRLEHFATLGKVQVATLKKLARVYGVTIDYLVYDVAETDADEEEAA